MLVNSTHSESMGFWTQYVWLKQMQLAFSFRTEAKPTYSRHILDVVQHDLWVHFPF